MATSIQYKNICFSGYQQWNEFGKTFFAADFGQSGQIVVNSINDMITTTGAAGATASAHVNFRDVTDNTLYSSRFIMIGTFSDCEPNFDPETYFIMPETLNVEGAFTYWLALIPIFVAAFMIRKIRQVMYAG